ncbi:alkaline phosphatase family protein (plasmid) [Phyllobacteriaceae bacterium JZ32]
MSRTIFILLDGLRYTTARECLGYMEGLVSAAEAQVYEVRSELPSISRPLYETLMSGLPPVAHGITSNAIVRRSRVDNVFSLATKAGLVTAAAAYHWYFELYNQAPFAPKFRHVEDFPGDIRHGAFYWDDRYPDSHLFADADVLLRRHSPDFLLLHSMNIDDEGHKHGGASREYRNAARNAGDLIARYLPCWREAGYTVLVTSDHGMSDDGNHGGPHETEARVPLYTVGANIFTLDAGAQPKQTEIAGLLCSMLGIDGHGLAMPQGLLRNRA